jgi:hypothetical protein
MKIKAYDPKEVPTWTPKVADDLTGIVELFTPISKEAVVMVFLDGKLAVSTYPGNLLGEFRGLTTTAWVYKENIKRWLPTWWELYKDNPTLAPLLAALMLGKND